MASFFDIVSLNHDFGKNWKLTTKTYSYGYSNHQHYQNKTDQDLITDSVNTVSYTHLIYLAGDSTVVDQDVEPWAAWGQMLPRFFRPGVVVANHAESGETTRSFVTEQRLAKIMSLIQPGDYLFIQFAHNDQKPNAVSLEDYKKLLIDYIAQARAKRATPVLVTSMNRRTFDAEGKITNSLAAYPGACLLYTSI